MNKWIMRAQYIALYLLGFVIAGLSSFISGDATFDKLPEGFWIITALSYAATICIIIATLLAVTDKFITTDEEFLECEQVISACARNFYIPSIFSRYSTRINTIRKINQHKANIILKLHKLENKAKEEDLKHWDKAKTLNDILENKYCTKRYKLEQQLDEKWIKENIDRSVVKYDKITPNLVFGGYYSKAENNEVNDFVTKGKSVKLIRQRAPAMLIGFAFITLATSVSLDFKFTLSGITTLLVKVLVIIYQIVISIRYSKSWNKSVTLKDIRFRRGVAVEYEKWLQDEANATSTRENEQINTHKTKFQTLTEGLEKEEILDVNSVRTTQNDNRTTTPAI